MRTLIIKLGATGDVVRTTPLLHHLSGEVVWLTEPKNRVLLEGLRDGLKCLSWEERGQVADLVYDLVINLEDTVETASYGDSVSAKRRFGARMGADGKLSYTEDSQSWFDLSIISRHGLQAADRLKLQNRRTYQDLIFEGLGLKFQGEPYLLPGTSTSDLAGDVAIAPTAGPVWPMKNWAGYEEVKSLLEKEGLTVNVLPKRSSLLEHLADVRAHRCMLCGDSLPMHFALGSGVPCVTLFTCTSPWEIYEYGLLKKLISPCLADFFYQRGFDSKAVTSISVQDVLGAVVDQLREPVARTP